MSNFPINRDHILEWDSTRNFALEYQAEQDMLICFTLINLFQSSELYGKIAFKGGTAMYKMHFSPVRYSEDIDLTIIDGSVERNDVMRAIRNVMQNCGILRMKGGAKFEFESTFSKGISVPNNNSLTVKIDVSDKDVFTRKNCIESSLIVENPWFGNKPVNVGVVSYSAEELIATKMIALYDSSRQKGRDLFDVWNAIFNEGVSAESIMEKFKEYASHYGNKNVTPSGFESILRRKSIRDDFKSDMEGLICTNFDRDWNFSEALEFVISDVISKL